MGKIHHCIVDVLKSAFALFRDGGIIVVKSVTV